MKRFAITINYQTQKHSADLTVMAYLRHRFTFRSNKNPRTPKEIATIFFDNTGNQRGKCDEHSK